MVKKITKVKGHKRVIRKKGKRNKVVMIKSYRRQYNATKSKTRGSFSYGSSPKTKKKRKTKEEPEERLTLLDLLDTEFKIEKERKKEEKKNQAKKIQAARDLLRDPETKEESIQERIDNMSREEKLAEAAAIRETLRNQGLRDKEVDKLLDKYYGPNINAQIEKRKEGLSKATSKFEDPRFPDSFDTFASKLEQQAAINARKTFDRIKEEANIIVAKRTPEEEETAEREAELRKKQRERERIQAAQAKERRKSRKIFRSDVSRLERIFDKIAERGEATEKEKEELKKLGKRVFTGASDPEVLSLDNKTMTNRAGRLIRLINKLDPEITEVPETEAERLLKKAGKGLKNPVTGEITLPWQKAKMVVGTRRGIEAALIEEGINTFGMTEEEKGKKIESLRKRGKIIVMSPEAAKSDIELDLKESLRKGRTVTKGELDRAFDKAIEADLREKLNMLIVSANKELKAADIAIGKQPNKETKKAAEDLKNRVKSAYKKELKDLENTLMNKIKRDSSKKMNFISETETLKRLKAAEITLGIRKKSPRRKTRDGETTKKKKNKKVKKTIRKKAIYNDPKEMEKFIKKTRAEMGRDPKTGKKLKK